MKIEITDEMMDAVESANDIGTQVRVVLNIIERNYIVQRRCTEQLSPDIRCELPDDRDGHALLNAQHQCRLGSTGTVVTWR